MGTKLHPDHPASWRKSLPRRSLNRLLALLSRFTPGVTTTRPMLHRARGVKIGKNVFIGDEAYLENEFPEAIEIGDRVQISIRATIIAHTRGPGRVIIEDDAFIGANCVIACTEGQTVRIGEGAVIGPGAIITRSVPPRIYLAVSPVQCVARVEQPLTQSKTIGDFRAGLRPLGRKPANGSPTNPKP